MFRMAHPRFRGRKMVGQETVKWERQLDDDWNARTKMQKAKEGEYAER